MRLFLKNFWLRLERLWKFDIYKSIDFLILFNFFKIIETGDCRYLLKLSDYESMPSLSEKRSEELKLIWLDIQNQYSKADDSNYQVINLIESSSLQRMQVEYLMLWNHYNLIVLDPNSRNTKKRLKYAGLENETLKSIEKKLKNLRNKIKLKEKDFEKKDSKPIDYLQIIDEIEDIKGRSLDIMKTTVRQYIAIRKNIKRKNGKRQNNAKGRTR